MKRNILTLVLFAMGVLPCAGQSICSSMSDSGGLIYGTDSCGAGSAGLTVSRTASWEVHYQWQRYYNGGIVGGWSELASLPAISMCGLYGFECAPVINANSNINVGMGRHEWTGYVTDGRYLLDFLVCVNGLVRSTTITNRIVFCESGC